MHNIQIQIYHTVLVRFDQIQIYSLSYELELLFNVESETIELIFSGFYEIDNIRNRFISAAGISMSYIEMSQLINFPRKGGNTNQ